MHTQNILSEPTSLFLYAFCEGRRRKYIFFRVLDPYEVDFLMDTFSDNQARFFPKLFQCWVSLHFSPLFIHLLFSLDPIKFERFLPLFVCFTNVGLKFFFKGMIHIIFQLLYCWHYIFCCVFPFESVLSVCRLPLL